MRKSDINRAPLQSALGLISASREIAFPADTPFTGSIKAKVAPSVLYEARKSLVQKLTTTMMTAVGGGGITGIATMPAAMNGVIAMIGATATTGAGVSR